MSYSFSDMCCFCVRERESVDHIFLHLGLASYIWGYFFKKCNVAWCTPISLGELTEAWRGSPLVGCELILWKIIPFSILWSIWKEMNEGIFSRKESSWEDILSKVSMRIAHWACARKEFSNVNMDDILYWGACLLMGEAKKRKKVTWHPPPSSCLKFNVDRAACGKPGPASIGGVLRNHKREVLYMFSKNMGVKDSNEAEVLAILEAIRICCRSFHISLIIETEFFNAVSWAKDVKGPLKMQFYFNEIKHISLESCVFSQHINRFASGMVDT